jgi:hypothetical protein
MPGVSMIRRKDYLDLRKISFDCHLTTNYIDSTLDPHDAAKAPEKGS